MSTFSLKFTAEIPTNFVGGDPIPGDADITYLFLIGEDGGDLIEQPITLSNTITKSFDNVVSSVQVANRVIVDGITSDLSNIASFTIPVLQKPAAPIVELV